MCKPKGKYRSTVVTPANAEETLHLHKTRRAGDLTRRSAALEELAGALDLPEGGCGILR